MKKSILRIFGKKPMIKVEISQPYNVVKKEEIVQPKNISTITQKQEVFAESIKVEKDIEKEKLLSVQSKIEKSKLDASAIGQLLKDLSRDEIIKLKELYKIQIKKKEEELQLYRAKIIAKKQKLATNIAN